MNTLYECDGCHGHGYIEYDVNKKIDCGDCKGDGYVTIDMLNVRPVKQSIDEMFECIGILAQAGITDFSHGMKGSIPFKIGDKFKTLRGTEVECIQLSNTKGYECARFSDGAWRYNRDHDRGRCTGSRWDDPKNIVPMFHDDEKDTNIQPMTGYCRHKNSPGGCQLHNIYCGYPKCDIHPIKSKVEYKE